MPGWLIVLVLVVVAVIVLLLIAWLSSRHDTISEIEQTWDKGVRRGDEASRAAQNETNRMLRR